MSEAADAITEVEDFFNEQIFGAPPAAEAEPIFPDAPPGAKPIEAVVAEEEVETEMVPNSIPEAEEPVSTAVEEPVEESVAEEAEDGEPEYVTWARKQYGEDIDLTSESSQKLAKAAFEKERMLGKKAEEARRLQQEAEQREVQARIDALNTPGALTPEEDAWVNEALISDDPGKWAYNALEAERPDLYATIMDRWAALGEAESRRARVLHSRVLQAVAQPQPSEQETYTAALGQTFLSLGLSIEQHGPAILAKAEELGSNHPSVQGMMSPDDDVRRIATRAIYDLVAASRTTVAKARTDDVVQARVEEEKLRQQAAGIQQGGPRVEQPKKSTFWEQFDAEIEQRGWDGQRPHYGNQ